MYDRTDDNHEKEWNEAMDAQEYDSLMDEIAYHKADAKKWNDEVNALLTLAEDAHAAWDKDEDARVGKLLLAMMDEVFRKTYRPDLVKVGADRTATPNVELTGAARHERE